MSSGLSLIRADGFILDETHFHLLLQAEAIPVPKAHRPLRLLATGSRDFSDDQAVGAVLVGIAEVHGPLHVTEGECHQGGLDLLAHHFAVRSGWGTTRRPVRNWSAPCRPECYHRPRKTRTGKSFCPTQGNYRNQEMVDEGHDLCVGWMSSPRSAGTLDCMSRASLAGIPTYVVAMENGRWAIHPFLRDRLV